MTSPLSPEAVAQMVDTLKDRRASWLGDGSSPDKLCADAADMLTTLSAENATLRAENEELDFLRHEGGPDSVAAMEIELATLRASEAAAMERVTRLEAALEEILSIDSYESRETFDGSNKHVVITKFGEFGQIAHAALTPTADKEQKT